MTSDPVERELRDFFAGERERDRRAAPPFDRVLATARRSALRRARVRRSAVAAALLAAAAGLTAIFFSTRPENSDPWLLKAQALAAWEAPTDEVWSVALVADAPGLPELTLTTITIPEPTPRAGQPADGA